MLLNEEDDEKSESHVVEEEIFSQATSNLKVGFSAAGATLKEAVADSEGQETKDAPKMRDIGSCEGTRSVQ